MQAKKTKTKTKNRKRKIRRRRVLRKNMLRRNRRIPAAYTKNFNKMFKVVRQDGNSMTVKGRDLVYAIPDGLKAEFQDTSVVTVIPCNPCYWVGTRVSAIANGYQNYRPLKFTVHYVPQCAVTQQGNVICGTLWNQTPASSNLQQTLRTSSGGVLTQCYKPATSVVSMRSNLQFNLFRCGGKFDQESNPFNFIAISVGCTDASDTKIIPGYFYVNWEYSFKNPIGYSTAFRNSGLKPLSEMDLTMANTTLISCQADKDVGTEVGMIIQVDKAKDSDELLFTYNNTNLNLSKNSSLLCWNFSNRPLTENEIEHIPDSYEYPYTLTGNIGTGAQGSKFPPKTMTVMIYPDDPNQVFVVVNALDQPIVYTNNPFSNYKFYQRFIGNNDNSKLWNIGYFDQYAQVTVTNYNNITDRPIYTFIKEKQDDYIFTPEA
jgi:hypothetical protein